MKSLNEMTLEELRTQEKLWWDARNKLLIEQATIACTILGEITDSRYFKYTLVHGDLKLWVDSYGHSMTIDWRDKRVYSSSDLYIPGNWELLIEPLFQEASIIIEKKRKEEDKKERLNLLERLTLPE